MAQNGERPRRRKTSLSARTPLPSLEKLAAQQGVKPVTNFEKLYGDFWPEDENIDDL
jgi:hypothetical protein